MAKRDKWEWLKRCVVILVGIGTLVGMSAAAMNFFAKAKTVNLMDRRLELAIEDDNVNRAQGEVDWAEQRVVFERRTDQPTTNDIESVERAKLKVIDAKERRALKQKAYEAAK